MADLFLTVPQEVPRLREFVYGASRFVASQNTQSAGLMETVLHLSETPSNLSLTVNLSVNVSETIRLRDWIYGAGRDTTASHRMAGLVEGPTKWLDSGAVVLQGPGAALKISEQLSVWLSDIYQVETFHLSDFVYGASIGPPATVLSAGLQEQILAIGEFLAQLFIIKLTDELPKTAAGPGTVELLDTLDPPLRIQDTVTVQLIGNDLLASVTETLKLADTVTVLEDPEQTSTASESLKIQDTVTVLENPEQTSGFDELLHVVDQAPTLQLTKLFASGFDELLHVQDTVTVSMGGLSVLVTAESLKIADTVTVLEDPEQTSSPAESLKVQDTVTVLLNPLQTSGFDELVHVQDSGFVQRQIEETILIADTVTAGIAGQMSASATETLKLADSVTVVLTPLLPATAPAETLKLADASPLAAQLVLTLVVSPESLHVLDIVVDLRENPLQTSLTDVCFLSESVGLSSGPPIVPAYRLAYPLVPPVGRMQLVLPIERMALL